MAELINLQSMGDAGRQQRLTHRHACGMQRQKSVAGLYLPYGNYRAVTAAVLCKAAVLLAHS